MVLDGPLGELFGICVRGTSRSSAHSLYVYIYIEVYIYIYEPSSKLLVPPLLLYSSPLFNPLYNLH